MKQLRPVVISLVFLCLLSSVECFGDTYWGLVKRGNRYFKNELYGDALRYYREGEQKNRGALEPVFNMGDALYKSEDYRGSIEAFERSMDMVKRDYEKADIYYNLGNSYFKVGEYDRSIESYIMGLELNPTNLNMKHNLELAIKRRNEQKEKRETEGETKPPGGGGEKGDETEPQKERGGSESVSENEREGQADMEERNKSDDGKELSREEAERLLSSVNSEQVELINDIIRQRVTGEETENDW